MTAIEIASLKGFQSVWLESDSQLVNLAFKSNLVVPWCLRNRWQNCLVRLRNMRFVVSHIYREGNACADSLANLGLSFPSFELFWYDIIPDLIKGEYIRNRLGMPNFRFNTFWKGFGWVSLIFLFCTLFWFNIMFWCCWHLFKKIYILVIP